ncbi:hypothetical protein OG989_04240 [Micromonospora sp. NBC_01740]|uniref:hypothetical protein n=1 Tax=Micromonospora sp. NBC_01740 TaxID=2975986 RepID=UPI002E1079C8|nr:hypothetical protein OG989_04240 [Micromonospora sp. NBC_01740]
MRGWSFERFGSWEIREATGSPWIVSASIDSNGFDLMLVRWEIRYVRKSSRAEVAR